MTCFNTLKTEKQKTSVASPEKNCLVKETRGEQITKPYEFVSYLSSGLTYSKTYQTHKSRREDVTKKLLQRPKLWLRSVQPKSKAYNRIRDIYHTIAKQFPPLSAAIADYYYLFFLCIHVYVINYYSHAVSYVITVQVENDSRLDCI